jgi:diacylglycerol kinase family enzyme
MDNHDIKEYRRQISNMAKERQDMLVVIDTLQQILGRAESIVKELDKEKYDYVFSQAAKWSLNWKPE